MSEPRREIPIPTSISPQAQAMLARPPFMGDTNYPAVDDIAAWHQVVEGGKQVMAAMFSRMPDPAGVTVEDLQFDGFPVYVARPAGKLRDDRVLLEVHGGAFIFEAGEVCRKRAQTAAVTYNATVWAVDYRQPPTFPYPAAVDDTVATYRAMLERYAPEQIIVSGISAGSTIAAASILRARDEGLPLPAAAILQTAAVDLTASGDSVETNRGLDTVLVGDLKVIAALYAGGHDPRDPYVSPLFGDFGKGFPPTILTTGTRDRLLSDTVRMHRALHSAGVPAELHVWEAATHGMFLGQAPEDQELARELRRFADAHWPSQENA